MAETPNMHLPIPSGSTGLNDLQSALSTIDAHTHEDGDGVQINQRGINLTGDLSLNQNRLTQAKDVTYVNNATSQTGSLSTYVADGYFCYRDSDGIEARIAKGGAVIVSGSGGGEGLVVDERTSDVTISAGTLVNTYVFTDTGIRTVTLPAASAVSDGTYFWIKDGTSPTGSTRISVLPAGSDTINGSGSSLPQPVYDNALVFRGESATWWMQRSPFKAVNDVSASIVASLATVSSSINSSIVSASNALSFTSASLRQTISNLSSSVTASFAAFALSITSSFSSASLSIANTATSQSILINNLRAPQFLALASSTETPNERVFTPGTGLKATDGGAGATYTVNVNDTVVATVSGTTFTGNVNAGNGLSGSLQRTTSGLSYLVAGTGITVSSASNGQVTIASTVTSEVTLAGANVFTNTNTFPTITSAGSDTVFAKGISATGKIEATGSIRAGASSRFAADVHIAGSQHNSGTLNVAGRTELAGILGVGGSAIINGNLSASGSATFSKDSFHAGTAHFSGSVNVANAFSCYLTSTLYNTSQTGSHTFDTRWRYAEVEIVGGGGAGGGVDGVSTSDIGCGGGGAGGAMKKVCFTRSGVSSVVQSTLTTGSTFIVGHAGVGASNADGGVGGTSRFFIGSTSAAAAGGDGGSKGTAAGDMVVAGGDDNAAPTLDIFTIDVAGGQGGGAGFGWIGSSLNNGVSGGGGCSGGGGGGARPIAGSANTASSGRAGEFPGGGGSGGRSATATDVAGGDGAVGKILVKEWM